MKVQVSRYKVTAAVPIYSVSKLSAALSPTAAY